MDKTKETLVEAMDHAGNKVMIPWSEAQKIYEHMEKYGEKSHFDPAHCLQKAREKMQDADWEHVFPDTEEKIKCGLMKALDIDYGGAEYLGEAIEAIVAEYFLKSMNKHD